MGMLQTVLLALGLAMDAFAVSVASGIILRKESTKDTGYGRSPRAVASGIAIQNLRIGHALRIATAFGLFQAVMPLIGWLAGMALQQYIAGIDHWVAFGMLTFIGGKMIYEATKMEQAEQAANPLNLYVLLILSIATSMDALAVGITFAMLGTAIITPALVIGSVTFVLCLAGVYIGDVFGHFFEKKLEILGGVVLIGIGLKILIEHLLAP